MQDTKPAKINLKNATSDKPRSVREIFPEEERKERRGKEGNKRQGTRSDKEAINRGAKKHSIIFLEQREKTVTELYMDGYTMVEIAQRLGLSKQQVSVDIAATREEWKERRAELYDIKVAEEEAKLRDIEAKARRAYEQSTRRFTRVGKQMVESEIRSPGNPAFLELAKKCIDTRLRVMGALKGTTINVNSGVSVWDMIMGASASVEVEGGNSSEGRPRDITDKARVIKSDADSTEDMQDELKRRLMDGMPESADRKVLQRVNEERRLVEKELAEGRNGV